MSEFWMVEEFQKFLEAQDPEFVKGEMHYLAENSRQKGVDVHTSLYPLFLNPRITNMYRRFSHLVWNAVERVVEKVAEQSELGEELRKRLNVDDVLRQFLDYQPIGGRMPRIIRPDTVYSGGKIQAHEVNVSWPGNLFRADLLLQSLDQNTLYRRFKEQMAAAGTHIHRPRKYYNSSLVLEQLVDASGKERPYIVIIVPKETQHQVRLHTWFRDYAREKGFECDVVFPEEFEYDGERATVKSRPIDVAYRIFEWYHVLGDTKNEGYRRVVQADIDGKLAVVNTFASELVSAKSLFEVFWDDGFRDCFDEGELDELRQYIPRTANLSRVSDEIVRDVLENKDSWVLKPVKGSSGRGVYLGRELGDDRLQEWRDVIGQARRDGTYIVQEYVESPTLNMAVVRGDNVVQMQHYPDINPPIIGGRMGHQIGRCSPSLYTAMMAYDHGGIYPILTHDNPKKI